MILLTVGTQLPFDRLVDIVDRVAPDTGEEVFGQIGKSTLSPRNFTFQENLPPRDFESKITSARVLVSHAGIGSILTARKYNKPIILFPRLAAHNEHRNDHQLATCAQLKTQAGIYVATDEGELRALLMDKGLVSGSEDPGAAVKRRQLTDAIGAFIGGGA